MTIATTAVSSAPYQLFILSATEDSSFKEELTDHLEVLQRKQYITLMPDIAAGEELTTALQQRISQSDVILLLLSADFLNDDALYNLILQPLDPPKNRIIIPILVRACLWEDTPFAQMQLLPENKLALTSKSWDNLDDAIHQVLLVVRNVLLKHQNPSQPTVSAPTKVEDDADYIKDLSQIRQEKARREKRKKYIIRAIEAMGLVGIGIAAYRYAPLLSEGVKTIFIITAVLVSLGVLIFAEVMPRIGLYPRRRAIWGWMLAVCTALTIISSAAYIYQFVHYTFLYPPIRHINPSSNYIQQRVIKGYEYTELASKASKFDDSEILYRFGGKLEAIWTPASIQKSEFNITLNIFALVLFGSLAFVSLIEFWLMPKVNMRRINPMVLNKNTNTSKSP